MTKLTILIPPRGKKPSTFRRKLIQRLREAAVYLHFTGAIGAEIAEEIHRALPIEKPSNE